jgi:hypothetical protein
VNTVIAVVAIGGTAWALGPHGIDGAGWAWTAGEVAGCVVLAVLAAVEGRVGPRARAPRGVAA